jgi:ABC-type multidrug transport system fused ATPase/permease subunit
MNKLPPVITTGGSLVYRIIWIYLVSNQGSPFMNISYFLLQLPPFVLMVCIIGLFALAGMAGTYYFRKFIRIDYKRSHNEMVGYIFAILGGFYGLLLGFVVFLVWDSVNGAQNNANREGSLARGLYRDIRYYPDTAQMKPLMVSYLKYVHSAVEEEYPAMEQMKSFTKDNRKYFNEVFKEMELLDAHDPKVEQMFRHLNDLATARSLRQLDASTEIAIEIWVPLLVGALIIMVFAMLVDVESLRLHMTVNGLLGAFIGMVIYIIIILDHPFSGKMKINPTEYNIILQMEKEGG